MKIVPSPLSPRLRKESSIHRTLRNFAPLIDFNVRPVCKSGAKLNFTLRGRTQIEYSVAANLSLQTSFILFKSC